MSAISDDIERFILGLLSETGTAELQRNTLAQSFSCAPSQINYVLATRFGADRGYVIESRRGGGGYVRVVRLRLAPDVTGQLGEAVGNSLTAAKARNMLLRLLDAGLVSRSNAAVLLAATQEQVLGPPPEGDSLRARIFMAALSQMLKDQNG